MGRMGCLIRYSYTARLFLQARYSTHRACTAYATVEVSIFDFFYMRLIDRKIERHFDRRVKNRAQWRSNRVLL